MLVLRSVPILAWVSKSYTCWRYETRPSISITLHVSMISCNFSDNGFSCAMARFTRFDLRQRFCEVWQGFRIRWEYQTNNVTKPNKKNETHLRVCLICMYFWVTSKKTWPILLGLCGIRKIHLLPLGWRYVMSWKLIYNKTKYQLIIR